MEQSTNALRRIAPEIKTMIFEYALKMSSQPRPYSSPSLLVALRAVPDLYNEALEVFYKINTFILDVGSFTGFSRLKLEAVKLVRKVALDFTDSTYVSLELVIQHANFLEHVVKEYKIFLDCSLTQNRTWHWLLELRLCKSLQTRRSHCCIQCFTSR
jgi:hypothetical protein